MRLYIILLISSLFACSQQHIRLNSSIPLLVMKRTACYGTCPQYTISIYNDGLVRYAGKMFVDKIGCFESSLSKKLISDIKLELNNVNFLEFQNEYDAHVTDVPSVIVKVYLEGETHEVIDRFNGPLELKRIHNFIDNIVDSIQEWHQCKLE